MSDNLSTSARPRALAAAIAARKIGTVKQWRPTPNPDRPPAALELPEMDQRLAEALSGALCTATYTGNEWALQSLAKPWEDIPLWRAAAPGGHSQDVARACFLKDWFRPIPSGIAASGTTPDPFLGKPIPYSYDNGVFHAGDLACGALFERKKLDGSTSIELCFRGTEMTTTGDASTDRKNVVGGYFLSAYKDMAGHYERHRPLIEEALRVVAERSALGERVELRVSGHSLGGSMAELFMKSDASRLPPGVEAKGCTFGSPGTGGAQSAFSMLVKGCVRLLMVQLGLREGDALRAGIERDRAREKTRQEAGLAAPPSERVARYVDPNDPIPKIGAIGGYEGVGRTLMSSGRKWDSTTRTFIEGKLSDMARHSCAGYAASRMHALKLSNRRHAKPVGPAAEAWARVSQSVADSREKAIELAIRVDSLGESPLGAAQYHSIADSVVDAATRREGMIGKGLPNARADDKRFAEGIKAIGTGLLTKLAARRASADEIQIATQAIARVSAARL